MFDFNIITFHRSNYGAILQAYALQEFIKKQNYSVGMFDYIKPEIIGERTTLKAEIQKILAKVTKDEKAKSRLMQRITEFREKYLNLNLETDSRVLHIRTQSFRQDPLRYQP